MPRYDGYPAADALNGSETLPLMQGGATKAMTPDRVADYVWAKIEPLVQEQIASGSPGGDPRSFLVDDAGRFLAEENGTRLIAA